MFNFRNINLLKGLQRFPLACAFAIFATCIAIYIIEIREPPTRLINIMLTCIVGGLCNVALTVASEAHRFTTTRLWLGRLGILLVLIAFYFLFLPASYEVYNTSLFRMPFQMAAIFLFLHLLISYIPFINKGSEEDFWEYNKDVFLNFVESMFYAFFLFAGLSIALVALDQLFGIEMDSLAYPRLFFFLVGIFNTLYFLSKYPTVYYDNQIKTPIKAFLIFSQYILIPLVLIYMAILYAYGIQIAFKWKLPEGWVSQLSLWFSVVGIFAFLLNYFNHKFSDFKLTAYYRKYFFLVIVLPILLVFIAIYRRISEYGVTELRYVVALLGVWLLGLALYFNLSKSKNIRVIPISLSLIVLIPILAGPFNMFNVTVSSQQKKFKTLLIDNAVLQDEELFKMKKFVGGDRAVFSKEQVRADSVLRVNTYSISDAIRFLDERTDLLFVNEWINNDLDFIPDNDSRMSTDSLDKFHNARILTDHLGIEHVFPLYDKPLEGENFTFNSRVNTSIEIDKNKFYVPLEIHANATNPKRINFKLNSDKSGLILFRNGAQVGEIYLLDYYEELINNIDAEHKTHYDLNIEDPLYIVQDSLYNASLIINNIGGRKLETGEITIDNIWGHAIIEFK